jgi:hypothetical protein
MGMAASIVARLNAIASSMPLSTRFKPIRADVGG